MNYYFIKITVFSSWMFAYIYFLVYFGWSFGICVGTVKGFMRLIHFLFERCLIEVINPINWYYIKKLFYVFIFNNCKIHSKKKLKARTNKTRIKFQTFTYGKMSNNYQSFITSCHWIWQLFYWLIFDKCQRRIRIYMKFLNNNYIILG